MGRLSFRVPLLRRNRIHVTLEDGAPVTIPLNRLAGDVCVVRGNRAEFSWAASPNPSFTVVEAGARWGLKGRHFGPWSLLLPSGRVLLLWRRGVVFAGLDSRDGAFRLVTSPSGIGAVVWEGGEEMMPAALLAVYGWHRMPPPPEETPVVVPDWPDSWWLPVP